MQDSSSKQKAVGGPGRASTSCSECQRRKQKCDKKWPCKHCQDRRVPHLCNFKKRPRQTGVDADPKPPGTTIIRSISPSELPQKRQIVQIEDPDPRAVSYANHMYRFEQDLERLGYVGPSRNQKLRDLLGDAFTFTTKATTGVEAQPVKRGDSFPPKPYTDVLIHNFLDNINYIYCLVHPGALLEEYDSWWLTRRSQPNIELEGVLFRIMAVSAQFLPEPICERLETELSEDIVTLKLQWHESAETLARKLRPGQGGLKHVQNLVLSATFFKTEAMFVESWHALSAAIRTAQEIGTHRDSEGTNISDFEREQRRQVWTSLYTWDRLMAGLFDRPVLISRARCILVEPKIELHQDPIHPELPSPLLSRMCDFRLAKIIDKYLDENMTEAKVGLLVRPLKEVKEYLDTLPVVFRTRDPDTQWDRQHPRIKHARLGLHITAYSIMFHFLQPCLISDTFPEGSSVVEREKLRSACMEYSIRMTDVVDRLTRFATHSRFHMSFCLFETSATVCAALIKDRARKLPKRPQVLQALGRAQNILDRLGSNTAVAKSSAKMLTELISRLMVEQPDAGIQVTIGQSVPLEMDQSWPMTDPDIQDSTLGSSIDDSPTSSNDTGAGSADDVVANGDFDGNPMGAMDHFPSSTEELFGDMDLASIDQMWDWTNLDLSDLPNLNLDLNAGDWSGQVAGPEVH